jgi:uncharacterized phage protein (TIGR02218 family)
VLGDASCGVDLSTPGYRYEGALVSVVENRVFDLGDLSGFAPGWFQRGQLRVLDGTASGLGAAIKRDRLDERGRRVIELWEPLRATPAAGDPVRIEAGCDKRFETCRLKFDNALNFRGFPDLPGEDWIMVHPAQSKRFGGGSRR